MKPALPARGEREDVDKYMIFFPFPSSFMPPIQAENCRIPFLTCICSFIRNGDQISVFFFPAW